MVVEQAKTGCIYTILMLSKSGIVPRTVKADRAATGSRDATLFLEDKVVAEFQLNAIAGRVCDELED